ncbi:PREDICTED: uncharacterized protein LOC108757420 [Trachymyrmex cornetzi]|uniref:uncharacterized protein LOC108757420 n=1 Tax=Trachymyrmex cornetzi TaxID=471704 RepID=UPI00084F6CCA|nr:PREDICTED: uncharacterized protein LOC108757420 [Trachymyrmex cornetzi]
MIKLIQAKHFANEIKALNNKGTVQINSPILRLNPFIVKSGMIRVGGRLKESSLSYAAKHPILLPGKHPFSNLIVSHEHANHLHAGPQATLAAIREQYWIILARSTIKRILRKCVTCFRSSPKAASTIMGNLPEPRIRICTKPFDQCGVDYAGSLYYKEGARRSLKLVKCCIAILVCLVTKAVHVELASNFSSEAFLGVFRRFIARRGCPSDIFSDNGSNFAGAERELRESVELFKNQTTQQQIQEQATNLGIR